MDEELPEEIYEQVTELSEKGNTHLDSERYPEALQDWQSALTLLPEPKSKWTAATWLYASIGEAYWRLEQTEDARTAFENAYRSADGHINAFVLFYLGACLFELNDKENSTDYLLRAYMLDGDTIFNDEKPAYFDHLKKQNLIPDSPADNS